MVLPRSSNNNFILRNIDHSTLVKCQNEFWIPVKRNKSHPSKWMTVNKNEPSKEIFLEPWAKNENQQTADCVYFNTSDKHYHEANCNNLICALCEMEHSRFIYSLQSECAWEFLKSDSQFVLHLSRDIFLNDYFSSNLNQHTISMNKFNSHWNISGKEMEGQNTSSYAEYQNNYAGVALIVGNKLWKVHQCGDKKVARIKLANVS